MNKVGTTGALACAVLLLQSGCAHITMLRTEELRQVQARVDSLKIELAVAQKQLVDEQKQQNELIRLVRADQQEHFSQVEKDISSLSGTIYDSQDKISKISEQTQAIKKQWEEKASADSQEVTARNSEVENLFEIAHGDFLAGRYDVALSGFQDIISRFPDNPKTEEACYWAGECHYAKKKYNEAEAAFLLYIKNYPAGKKVCVALFKLGLVYESEKQTKHRNLVWQKLLEQCPGSEEASAVKARM